MEGQDVPAATEPQKVRNPKPRKQKGVQDKPPSIRKSNRGRGAPPQQQQQQQPEAANWGYDQSYGYGNVDPAHYYPEDYGHGTGGHDGHGYNYGYGQDATYGYGYDQEDGYGQAAAHGYGYDQEGYARDAAHGYGYGQHVYGEDAAHGYGYDQEHGYGGAEADAGADYGYVAPAPPVKEKAKKPKKPKPVAAGGDPHRAGYENQGDGFGQPLQDGYAESYADPEAHNAIVPEQQISLNPPKRESKNRKPLTTKSMESGTPGDGESAVASRALSAEPDGAGSARSSASNRSKPDRSDRSANADGSRHSRASNRLEQEGPIPRGARDQREGGSGRSIPERRKPNVKNDSGEGSAKPVKSSISEAIALDEPLYKPGGGKPALEPELGSTPRSTKDHREEGNGRNNPERRKPKLENEDDGSSTKSTKSSKSSKPEANALNEHLRKSRDRKPAFQDVSMAVFDPHDQTTLVSGFPAATPLARPSLDAWIKKQGNQAEPKFKQDESLVVFNDDEDKSELETRMFGAPLMANQQSLKLPHVEEKPWDSPQSRSQPRQTPQSRPVANQPLYHVRPRRAHASLNPPLPQAYNKEAPPSDADAIPESRPRYNKPPNALQKSEPSAKCMACVHGVGVPMTRLATRIACRQCGLCTIL